MGGDGTADEGADDAREAAGHAAHFLSRLDRVARVDVELALSLYNDAPLVTEILRRARIPDGAARVAIALADGGQGPHIIVTRDAKFVTCLAEGMRPNGVPVVARGQLDAFARDVESLRSKIALSKQLVGGTTPITKLFARVLSAGAGLSREEFRAACAWIPLLRGAAVNLVHQTVRTHDNLLARALTVPRWNAKNVMQLERLTRNMWAGAHLLMLLSDDARATCERFEAIGARDGLEMLQYLANAALCVGRIDAMGLSLRAAYFAARCGKATLLPLKRAFLAAFDPHQVIAGFALLAGTGHRHERLRGEIQKALATTAAARTLPKAIPPGLRPGVVAAFDALLTACRTLSDRSFADPDAAIGRTIERSRRFATVLGEQEPDGPLHPPGRELPDDVLLALVVSTLASPERHLDVLFDALPWTARAAPEDFYLPAAWNPESDLISGLGTTVLYIADRKALPKSIATKVGRNAPCTCGSGKKSKRCCYP